MINLFRKKKEKPELRQYGALLKADFERSPVWVQCHIIDYNELWFEDTDEETFRPWTANLPIDPALAIFLIRSSFALGDGTKLEGFVTPSLSESDLGTIQPILFLPDGHQMSFWRGMLKPNDIEITDFYQTLKKSASGVFPIRFSVSPGLCKGFDGGTIEGFYFLAENSSVKVLK
jgi:hypothetical protein